MAGKAPRLDPSDPNKFTPPKYVPPVSDRDHAKKKTGRPKPPKAKPK